MRLVGVLSLGFAGSFATTVITIDWPEGAPSQTMPAQGLAARTPAMHLAASSNALPRERP